MSISRTMSLHQRNVAIVVAVLYERNYAGRCRLYRTTRNQGSGSHPGGASDAGSAKTSPWLSRKPSRLPVRFRVYSGSPRHRNGPADRGSFTRTVVQTIRTVEVTPEAPVTSVGPRHVPLRTSPALRKNRPRQLPTRLPSDCTHRHGQARDRIANSHRQLVKWKRQNTARAEILCRSTTRQWNTTLEPRP